MSQQTDDLERRMATLRNFIQNFQFTIIDVSKDARDVYPYFSDNSDREALSLMTLGDGMRMGRFTGQLLRFMDWDGEAGTYGMERPSIYQPYTIVITNNPQLHYEMRVPAEEDAIEKVRKLKEFLVERAQYDLIQNGEKESQRNTDALAGKYNGTKI